jgi:hypothetical protein
VRKVNDVDNVDIAELESLLARFGHSLGGVAVDALRDSDRTEGCEDGGDRVHAERGRDFPVKQLTDCEGDK